MLHNVKITIYITNMEGRKLGTLWPLKDEDIFGYIVYLTSEFLIPKTYFLVQHTQWLQEFTFACILYKQSYTILYYYIYVSQWYL